MTKDAIRKKIFLKPVSSFEGQALIYGMMLFVPVLRGIFEDGIDFVCGVCRNRIIVEKCSDDQLWDIAFKCSSCGGLSVTPALPPGRALPRNTLQIPPGWYNLDLGKTIEIKTAVIASNKMVEQRLREIGLTFLGPEIPTNLNKNELRFLIDKTKNILGGIFCDIYEKHKRGKSSITTPPRNPHRLMGLIESVERSIEDYPAVDADAIGELLMITTLLEQWHNDPSWPTIIKSMRHPQEYGHSVILLSVARYLLHAGNAVEIHPPSKEQGIRSPDLRVIIAPREHIGIEVKAPLILQDHSLSTYEDAKRVIESAYRKASGGNKGQLKEAHPGILVIGGYSLPPEEIDLLEDASRHFLAKRMLIHIAGIMIIVNTVWTNRYFLNWFEGIRTTLQVASIVRFIPNGGYNGSIQVQTNERQSQGLTATRKDSATRRQC